MGKACRVLVGGAVLVGAACGGASHRAAEPALDRGALADWSGKAAPEGSEGPASSGPSPSQSAERRPGPVIELGSGERFRELVAFTLFRVHPDGERSASASAPHCSVYVLTTAGGSLAEGRRSIPCPQGGWAGVQVPQVPLRSVDDPRRDQLQSVLGGARPSPRASEQAPDPGPGGVQYDVMVRVRTDRRTIEGRVPPPAWPPPGERHGPRPRQREPRNLAELWEAVMYPGRYGRPARGG